jgi:hypothetical protein
VPNVIAMGTPPEVKAAKVVVVKRAEPRAFDRRQDHSRPSPAAAHDPLPSATEGERRAEGPGVSLQPSLFWDADPAHSKTRSCRVNPRWVVWIDISREHYGPTAPQSPARSGAARPRAADQLGRARLAAMAGGTPVIFER